MSIKTIKASEIQVGDVILAASPRYHGPDVRVTSVEHISYGRPFSIAPSINFGVERMSGTPTRLTSVPMDKAYSVERNPFKAGLGVGHVWWATTCPAYRTQIATDCTCGGAQEN